jgi:membrane-associated protease RseP (regulator of RpoE activity)
MNSHIPILIAAVFGVLLAHELGHLVAARYLGVTVTSIAIGLGPEILGFTDRFGTRWKLAAWLIGGSCSMSAESSVYPTKLLPAQRSLAELSLQKQAIILAAGPVANIALAIALFAILLPFIERDLYSDAVERREIGYAFLISAFSLSVGLFNHLPFLPLDGGRLLLVAVEAYRGRPVLWQGEWILRVASALSFALATLASASLWLWH